MSSVRPIRWAAIAVVGLLLVAGCHRDRKHAETDPAKPVVPVTPVAVPDDPAKRAAERERVALENYEALTGKWQASAMQGNCLITYDIAKQGDVDVDISCLDGHHVLRESYYGTIKRDATADGSLTSTFKPITCKGKEITDQMTFSYTTATKTHLKLGGLDLMRVPHGKKPKTLRASPKAPVKTVFGCFKKGDLRNFVSEG